jgi:acyl-CoA dehydrogenase
VAAAYERAHGRFSRVHQFALAYLFTPSTDIYSCPLAMTDRTARALLDLPPTHPWRRRILRKI